MNRSWITLAVAVLFVLALGGCSADRSVDPQPSAGDMADDANLQRAAAEIAAMAGWELAPDVAVPTVAGDKTPPCFLVNFDREVLVDDIVHYSIELQVGPEPYGVIGLHRVVRESRPYRPIRARKSLFMLHGAGVGFVNSFMASTQLDYIPYENSLPIFMAQHDIDVWGIDMAWTFIPGDEEDLSFAADWGLQREVDDLRAGLGVARFVRLFTGNGWRKMDLLGWSMGEGKGYAYLSEESQLPPGHRHVKGFIPVDGPIRSDIPEATAHYCNTYQSVAEARAGGVYVDSQGALAQFAAFLAATDPDGESPIFPGFTNALVVLGAATQTNLLLGGYPPHYHLLAGVFDENFLPVGFQFVEPQFGIDFYASWVPYQPNLIFLERAAMGCDDHDVVFDDHFADITVPILYVSPGGGYGTIGEYMATQVGSTDFQSHIVSLHPEPLLDIGHVDIFAGHVGVDLPLLVWQPILDWMRDHRAAEDPDLPLGVTLLE